MEVSSCGTLHACAWAHLMALCDTPDAICIALHPRLTLHVPLPDRSAGRDHLSRTEAACFWQESSGLAMFIRSSLARGLQASLEQSPEP